MINLVNFACIVLSSDVLNVSNAVSQAARAKQILQRELRPAEEPLHCKRPDTNLESSLVSREPKVDPLNRNFHRKQALVLVLSSVASIIDATRLPFSSVGHNKY